MASGATASLMGAASSVDVNVSINLNSTVGALRRGQAGFSYEKSKVPTNFFSTSNAALIAAFRRLGSGFIRIGGNSADQMQWNPTGTGGARAQVAPADIDQFATFLRTTNYQAIYGINLPTNTLMSAVSEVSYVAKALGDRLVGIEIGNECDVYFRNGLRPPTYTVENFVPEWSTYADAIRKATPGIPFGAPASSYRIDDWTVPFANARGNEVAYLSEHLYIGNGKSAASTAQFLLAPHGFIAKDLDTMLAAVQRNRIAGGYRMTEVNSLYSGGRAGVSDAHAAALWAVDFLLTSARHNCAGVNFHGGGDGSYVPPYTPIADVHNVVTELRPLYYGMLLVNRISPGPLCDVSISSGPNLSAFAVASSESKSLVLIVVNKEPNTDVRVTVDAGINSQRAFLSTLTAPAIDAVGATAIDGVRIAPDSTAEDRERLRFDFKQTKTVTVGAASAAVLELEG